jgi:hypothetical protein
MRRRVSKPEFPRSAVAEFPSRLRIAEVDSLLSGARRRTAFRDAAADLVSLGIANPDGDMRPDADRDFGD